MTFGISTSSTSIPQSAISSPITSTLLGNKNILSEKYLNIGIVLYQQFFTATIFVNLFSFYFMFNNLKSYYNYIYVFLWFSFPYFALCALCAYMALCTLYVHYCPTTLTKPSFSITVVPHELEILSRFLEIWVNFSEELGLNWLKIFYFHCKKYIWNCGNFSVYLK